MLSSLLSCLCDKHEDEAIELPPVVNDSLICKIGNASKNLQVFNDTSRGTYILSSNGGKGMALGSFSLECDCGKWEVVIKKKGTIQVGVVQIRQDTDKDSLLNLTLSDLNNLNKLQVNYITLNNFNQGDILTILWDLTDYPMLKFLRNNNYFDEVYKLKSCHNIYPAFSIENDGEIEVIFDERSFNQKHPKYGMIINSTNLI